MSDIDMLTQRGFIYKHPSTGYAWDDQVSWLLNNLGENSVRWEYHRTKFWFKDKRDYTMFLLRWS